MNVPNSIPFLYNAVQSVIKINIAITGEYWHSTKLLLKFRHSSIKKHAKRNYTIFGDQENPDLKIFVRLFQGFFH